VRKVLIVIAVLLIGGLIAADRIGVMVAQNEIGRKVAQQNNLPETPKVSIHGFPFLTQAIGGTYDRIDVNVGDYTTPENITVHDLKIQLSGLHASLGDVINNNTSNITADTGTASAIIPFDVIQKRAPSSVKSISASGSDLQVKGTFSVAGFIRTPLTITARLATTAKGIAVTPDTVQGATGPSIPVGLLQQTLTFVVPVSNLPIGSRISQIEVTPTGVRVAATANNVHFSELPAAAR
jgi:hypothetical protein